MEKDWLGASNKGVAIIRVSSHRQKDNSPEVQAQVIQDYANAKGIKIVRVEKIIESAKDSVERTKFKKAIDDAIKGNIRHILFYMTDRECRNYTDLENNVRLIKQDRIVLHYAREGRLLWKYSPQSDFLMREFQTLQDKQVSATISIKVNDAQLRKAGEGWYPGNNPPLGYAHRKLKDELGREKKRGTTIDRDPDERRVQQVQREFELRAQGYSYEQIRKQVIREGFILPSRIVGYSAGVIERRIKNSFYRGSFIWQGQEYTGKHPRIIPAHILSILDSGPPIPRGPLSGLPGIFSGGWLRCATCGCSIVYDPKTKENKKNGQKTVHHYYHCTNAKKQHTSMRGMNVTESKIFQQFESALGGISINKSFAVQIAEALNEVNAKARNKTIAQAEGYKLALGELERREDRIYDDLIRGALDDTGYRRQLQRIREERSHFTKLLTDANLEVQDAYMEKAETILELAISAKSLWESMNAKSRRELLSHLVSNPVLDGPTVRFTLKKPFAMIAKMKEEDDWRPQGDSNPRRRRERAVSWAGLDDRDKK